MFGQVSTSEKHLPHVTCYCTRHVCLSFLEAPIAAVQMRACKRSLRKPARFGTMPHSPRISEALQQAPPSAYPLTSFSVMCPDLQVYHQGACHRRCPNLSRAWTPCLEEVHRTTTSHQAHLACLQIPRHLPPELTTRAPHSRSPCQDPR